MPIPNRSGLSARLLPFATLAALVATSTGALADSVTLKNGLVYRGTVDKDDTLVSIFDGLKRVLVHDTQVVRTDPDPSTKVGVEKFTLIQPIEKQGGQMPPAAIGVSVGPWDENGRRTFTYLSVKSNRTVRMTQALNELGPALCKFRGIDEFWQGLTPTNQIPRTLVIALIYRGQAQANVAERTKLCRFLIQAEWYPESIVELEKLGKDFPETRDMARNTRQNVLGLQAQANLAELKVRRAAQQPREVASRLRAFATRGVGADVLNSVREQTDALKVAEIEDHALADHLGKVVAELSPELQKETRPALAEILRILTEAPDAARPRLAPFAKAESDSTSKAESRLALALSGWAVGPDAAVADLPTAEVLWEARGLVRDYLRSRAEDARAQALAALQALELPSPTRRPLDLETVTRLARQLPPPLRGDDDLPGRPRICRVLDDPNQDPTEYTVLLPPEYHPARTYPAVVALHNGQGMDSAIDWWKTEAMRRGYIVIAPEYNTANPPDYLYSTAEHAAVELALRDARKRFSIDGDRVYLGGQGLGGDMAWDFGLGHPDLFAGVAPISGIPAKHALAYHRDRKFANDRRLPLYIALGDLAGAGETVLDMAKDMITRNYNVTYVEYFKRGRDNLPEEAAPVFDWMATLRRDPAPRQFAVCSSRVCDDRFFGIVLKEFSTGRAPNPEAVDPQGKNLKLATIDVSSSNLSNLLKVNVVGVRQLDVWVSPRVLDFSKPIEVRVNRNRAFNGLVKPDFEPYLEDLRLRGDRQQPYWLKVPVRL